ncbi:MAG: hypothetical protein RLY66_9 [Candidatus Parcubacteria bacterium]|jgi:hypothetical protein
MKISHIKSASLGLFVAAVAILAHSSSAAALTPVLTSTGVSADVKVRMQADLASTSVDMNADGRVYKGGEKEGEPKNGQALGQIMASTSSSDASDDDVKSDKNVKKVESDDDSVSVSYKVPVKLFGFIPMGMVIRTTVGAAGDVKVSHPWYSFFATSDDNDAENDIKTEINTVINAYGVSGETKLSTSTKSAFIKAIHDVLKGAFETNASTSANVSTSN